MALLRATCEHGNPAGLCPYCEPFAFPRVAR